MADASPRILAVDSCMRMLAVSEALLWSSGYPTITAQTLWAAHQRIDATHPDL